MRKLLLLILIGLIHAGITYSDPVTGISAVSKNGQVFVTWTNLTSVGIEYVLYKSASQITNGLQLNSAENLGYVYDSSALNKRLSELLSIQTYLKIDSVSSPLLSTQGLFVATSTENGSFYYAIVTVTNGIMDTTIIAGANSLIVPVIETVTPPQPIWQQTRVTGSVTSQLYVQYGSAVTSSIYPKITNQGSFPFNFALSAPASGGSLASFPLEWHLHGGGGSFLQSMGTGFDSWAYGFATDDWLPNAGDFSSAWYGYNENYDVYSNKNHVPDTGKNESYTLHRQIYTMDWVEQHFPIDTTRVYLSGASMGASGSMWLAMYIPQRIAVLGISVPKFNLAILNDPDPGSYFNAGRDFRREVDTFLGTVPTDLLCDLGDSTYDFLNDGYMMHINGDKSLPIIFAQSGRNDSLTGWAEKIPFYDSVNTNRAGGFYYWDERGHNESGNTWNYIPNPYRYSTAISYPGFSNCSINGNPGNGYKNNGDSIGTINGYLDWNDTIIDTQFLWQIKLMLDDISTRYGERIAPDSCTVDVTLKRLQHFNPTPGDSVDWINYANDDKTILKQGGFIYNGGPITITNVIVYKSGNPLLVYIPQVSTIAYSSSSLNYSLQLFPNPSKGNEKLILKVNQPVNGLTIKLINLMGQVIHQWNYSSVNNNLTVDYDFSDLPKSEYFLQFTCDKFTANQKLIL